MPCTHIRDGLQVATTVIKLGLAIILRCSRLCDNLASVAVAAGSGLIDVHLWVAGCNTTVLKLGLAMQLTVR